MVVYKALREIFRLLLIAIFIMNNYKNNILVPNHFFNMKRFSSTILAFLAFVMVFTTVSAQTTKEEKKFWKNKAKMYKKRPMSLKAEFENYQSQIKDLKRRNKELLQQAGSGSEVNDLLDSLRWAVIQLEGELQTAKTENKKLELQYQSAKQFEMDDIKPGLVYRVQVVAAVFKEINEPGNTQEDIMVERADGFNKLLIGSFRTYEECAAFRDELRRQGLKDAWIVPYIDGVRVTIDDADKYASTRGISTKRKKRNK